MNEDDTFMKLKKPTFERMQEILMEQVKLDKNFDPIGYNDVSHIYARVTAEYGWTTTEFTDEVRRRRYDF